jgi:hypothetical protein
MEFSMNLKKKGIYFYFSNPDLYYLSVCLAEGFEQIGIPVYSNCSHYKKTYDNNCLLFEKSAVHPGDVALCVVDLSYYASGSQEVNCGLEKVSKFVQKYPEVPHVFISQSDDTLSLTSDSEAPFLVTHENQFKQLPGKRLPWAFGISNEMIAEAARSAEHNFHCQRKRVLLRNFKPSFNQPVRLALDLILVPKLEQYFRIDREVSKGGRFQRSHFSKLSSYIGCLAYGGTFEEDLARNDYFANKFNNHHHLLKEPIIVRWDSWRFWESLSCGCLTLHLDFDKYGFELPVKPTNWKHYIGLDLENISRDVDRIMDEYDRLPEIAEAGRIWALKNYSPKPVAMRFIDTMVSYGF